MTWVQNVLKRWEREWKDLMDYRNSKRLKCAWLLRNSFNGVQYSLKRIWLDAPFGKTKHFPVSWYNRGWSSLPAYKVPLSDPNISHCYGTFLTHWATHTNIWVTVKNCLKLNIQTSVDWLFPVNTGNNNYTWISHARRCLGWSSIKWAGPSEDRNTTPPSSAQSFLWGWGGGGAVWLRFYRCPTDGALSSGFSPSESLARWWDKYAESLRISKHNLASTTCGIMISWIQISTWEEEKLLLAKTSPNALEYLFFKL